MNQSVNNGTGMKVVSGTASVLATVGNLAANAEGVTVGAGNGTTDFEVPDEAVAAIIEGQTEQASLGDVVAAGVNVVGAGVEAEVVDERTAGALALMDDDDFPESAASASDSVDDDPAGLLAEDDGAGVDADFDLMGEPESNGLLEVQFEKCLNCAHLVTFAPKKYTKCHYTQEPEGVRLCPARSVKITVNLQLGPTVARFLRMEAEGNALAMRKFYAHLATKDEWVQTEIMAAINKARKAREEV